jgi:hypothetical protein
MAPNTRTYISVAEAAALAERGNHATHYPGSLRSTAPSSNVTTGGKTHITRRCAVQIQPLLINWN